MPIPRPLCGDAVLFQAVGAVRCLLLQTHSQHGNGVASVCRNGIASASFGVVHHELEEGREDGAVPPMAGSRCSPAELG